MFSDARIGVQRALVAIAIVFSLTLAAASPAMADVPRAFAGIVVDAKTGETLYASHSNELRYPASVTKVMTLYVLFQELAAGNIELDDMMTVSRHAANAVPTKLGLRSGSEISVENAIKSLVTLSANDMARVIAEHISGTESQFAQRMTDTARALGMNNTTYRNASGLPDSGQVTTVRDQARLAIAVYQHFPTYYEYFQTRSFTYGGRTYGNHNRLLGESGVDGIKTGYINASGYNLMTAARRDNRHVVVIAFGFNSGASRDARVRELLREYMPDARRGSYLNVAMIPTPGRQGQAVLATMAPPVPFPRPAFFDAMPVTEITMALSQVPVAPVVRPEDIQPAVAATSAAIGAVPIPATRPLDVIGTWLQDTFAPAPAPAPLGQTEPSAPLLPPVGIGEGGAAIDPMTSGAVQVAAVEQPFGIIPGPQPIVAELVPAPAPASGASDWVVQIGAAPSEAGATQLIGEATQALTALAAFRAYIERFERNGQVFFRARFDGFAGREAATTMCDELKRQNLSCLAMQS